MQLPVMQDNPSKNHQQPVATEMLSNIGEVTMYAIVWSDHIEQSSPYIKSHIVHLINKYHTITLAHSRLLQP